MIIRDKREFFRDSSFSSVPLQFSIVFPQASVTLEDFWLKGTGEFANDTLVQAGNSVEVADISIHLSLLIVINQIHVFDNKALQLDFERRRGFFFCRCCWVALKDPAIDMDLKLNTNDIGFKEILSLIPAIYATEFSSLKTTPFASALKSGSLIGVFTVAVRLNGFPARRKLNGWMLTVVRSIFPPGF